MEILHEQEVLRLLSLPSLPLRKWDGESFNTGVAVLDLCDGNKAYGIVTYDKARDKRPRVTRVFSQTQFCGMGDVFVVPNYMETDIDKMDFADDVSVEAARSMVDEARELEMAGVGDDSVEIPDNEYSFDFIKTDSQAVAFIESYNKKRGRRGRVPKSHEAIVARLAVIYARESKKKR